MLDALQFALAQIEFLVGSLTKKTYKQSVGEITQLVNQHGFEAERHLYRCLFSAIDFAPHEGRVSTKDYHQTQFLIQEINSLFAKPHFVTVLCYAVDHPFSYQKTLRPSNNLLPQISKVLKLNRVQDVTLGLALLSSLRPDMRQAAQQWMQQKLGELLDSYVEADAGGGHEGGGLQEISIEIVHLILTKLREDPNQFGVKDDLVEAFLRVLRKDFPKQRVPVVLNPLLYTDSEDIPVSKAFREASSLQQMTVSSASAMQNAQQSENALAELLEELGYDCTARLDEMRITLMEFNVRDITPAAVARCISMFMRTCDGQIVDQIGLQGPGSDSSTGWKGDSLSVNQQATKTWNIENFLIVICELNPGLQLRSLVPELDHSGFEVKSKRAFELLRKCLNDKNLSNSSDLPIEVFYRPWKNPSGQLSFFKWCLIQPDVICLSYWRYREAEIGRLKQMPDEENRNLQMWRNLDLLEALLNLSEQGFYTEVREIFDSPVRCCPDLLMLSLLQTQPDQNPGILKQELLLAMVSVFLANHPNAVPVLSYAWNHARPIVLHGLVDWVVEGEEKGDYLRVARVLEIVVNAFNGVESLAMVLKSRNHLFSLSLSCIAARREFLNLDVWLNERLNDYGELFAQAALKFLVSRSPNLAGKDDVSLLEAAKTSQLDIIVIQAILRCLERRHNTNNFSSETAKELASVMLHFTRSLPRMPVPTQLLRQQSTPGVPGATPTPADQLAGLQAQSAGVPMPPHPQFAGHFGKPPVSTFSSAPGAGVSVAGNSPMLPAGMPASMSSQLPNLPLSPASAMMKQNLGNRTDMMGMIPPQQMTPKHKMAAAGIPGMGMGSPHPSAGMGMPVPPVTMNPSTPVRNINQTMPTELTMQSSPELDERIGMIMKSLFSGTINIEDVFPMLKDKPLCNYFLRVLAEEFVHIPLAFPPKQKAIMAELFGQVIVLGFQLTNQPVLAYFLRLLSMCVTKPYETETDRVYFQFGLEILNKCKSSLSDYKQVASHLLSCSNFSKFPKDLQICIQIAANGSTVPRDALDLNSPTREDQRDGKAGEEAVEEVPVPSEGVLDTVYFIFNNLSKSNLTAKAADLRKAVGDEHIVWLGQHIVMKRATTEPNFHQLFIDLIDALDIPKLREVVLQQTFRSIRTLLQNMRPDLNDYNDRALLKNIGRFLGLLTIAKNRPILYDDMDLKGLLLEAYCKGQVEMHYAVPFVARTLEACAVSTVFRPPNPWTMGILRVLKELHMENTVKNSLKFEVEILCKKLNINFEEIEPAFYLRDSDRVRQIEVENCQIRSQSKPSEPEIRVGPMSAPAEEFEPSQAPVSGSSASLPHGTAAQAFAEAPSSDSTTHGNSVITAAPFHPQMPASGNATPAAGVQHAVIAPPPSASMQYPRFKWNDIDTSRSLADFFTVNQNLGLLQAHPQLTNQVPSVLEVTVNDLLEPVAQRCVRIVLATVEGIVRKDFALDDDEGRLRSAAHNMARFLTAGMALITCREALSINMENKLKQQFLHALSTPSGQLRDLIIDAAKAIACDNLELGTAFIQKVCVEKALVQIDVSLEADYRMRMQARQEGRRYFDKAQWTQQNDSMPPHLRKQIGAPSSYSLAVYSEYASAIPGFAHAPQAGMPPPTPTTAAYAAASGQRSDVAQLFDTIIAEVERQSQYINTSPGDNAQLVQRLRVLIERAQVAKQTGQDASASDVIKATIQSLFQTYKRQNLGHYAQEVLQRYKDAHTCILRLLYQPKISSFGYSSCMSHVVTGIWTEMPEAHKWNSEAFVELLKIHIVSLQALDSHLVKQIRGSNVRAIRFVMDLFLTLILCENREQTVLNECDLTNTITVLNQWIEKSAGIPEEYIRINQQIRALLDFGLLEAYQQPATPYLYSGCSQAREFDDPPWLQETSEGLMKKWYNMYSSQRAVDQRNFAAFVKEMTQLGILKTDDLITRFFRLTTDYVMEHCFRALLKSGQDLISNRVSCYQELDAYIRLIAIMVKHSGEQGPEPRESTASTKVNLLNKILGIIAGTLLQEQDIRSDRFHPMPFQRIFVLLFSELLSPSEADGTGSLAALATPVLAAFANALHIVRPAKAPAFTYSWVECISHRAVLSKFLGSPSSWPMYAQLLVDLLKFLSPFLASASFTKTVQLLYKGTLRVILILLHDFPDFISEYHHAFCDVIPPNCIQLRNLVLSAFPKVVQLLDPIQSSASLCYSLQEMQTEPKGSYAGLETNIPAELREEVDNFLSTRKPVTFLTDLQSRIRIPGEMGKRYDVELTNALVLYVGRHAVKRINESGNSLQPYNMTHCVETETLQALVMLCCTEGRYLLLNAMANQLRYPNSHTFYFNQVLLFFFRESNNEQIKEQITRVLLERLIVNRPHPWGLLLTFTELLKNQNYRFWEHEFVRCSMQIEKLLESVARSCVPGFRMPPVQTNASGLQVPNACSADSLARTTVTTASGSLSNGPSVPPVNSQ